MASDEQLTEFALPKEAEAIRYDLEVLGGEDAAKAVAAIERVRLTKTDDALQEAKSARLALRMTVGGLLGVLPNCGEDYIVGGRRGAQATRNLGNALIDLSLDVRDPHNIAASNTLHREAAIFTPTLRRLQTKLADNMPEQARVILDKCAEDTMFYLGLSF